MLFSSLTFVYYFLPACLALYFFVPAIVPAARGVRWRNGVLLFFSVVFYAWGEPVYILLLLGQLISGWVCGLLIGRFKLGGKIPLAKAAVAASVAIGIGALALFKYEGFFLSNISLLTDTEIKGLNLTMPLGISFYTFQILSYTIDLYRGRVGVQRNFADFATYVAMFPQLVAGPIVRYADVEEGLAQRSHSVTGFASGVRRFSIGLAKKVIIANTLGELSNICGASERGDLLSAWLYVIAFALQIYFDFSGYSDMAIGLGRMFGFHFPENFNYPYMAGSVTEFWRRWHMSMSGWFRDYVYIPLGGKRVSPARHIFNIMLTWLLTGFWHGAGWNFIAWGMYYGLLLLLEKYLLQRAFAVLPGFISHLWLVFCVLIGWIFFDAADMSAALHSLASMFGCGTGGLASSESLYYLRSYALPLFVALIGCSRLSARVASSVFESRFPRAGAVAEPIFIALLLLLSTAWLADGSFNPFIYFRF